MDGSSLGYILSLFFLAFILLVHRFWLRRHLPPTPARIGLLLLLAQFALVSMFEYSRHQLLTPGQWLWSLHLERNIPTFFSTYQMAGVGAIAWTITILARKMSLQLRAFWLFIGLGFFVLSMDEFIQLHEVHIGIPGVLHLYRITGILLLLFASAILWTNRGPSILFLAAVLLGPVIGAFGALILDMQWVICLPITVQFPLRCAI